MPHSHGPIANRLLLALPRSTLERLKPALELVNLELGQPIDRTDERVAHVYFVNRGIASLIKRMHDGRVVEIGAIGVEGVTDPNTLLGGIDTALMDCIVQVPGSALRIRRDRLRREADVDEALANTLKRYWHFYIDQIAQTAACNRLHSLEERCCRWLLTAHASALTDEFPLTHEFLATMLGVQRAGVSLAASMLQRAGMIRYSRGRVTIVDRKGLLATSCECYETLNSRFDRLLGPKKINR